MSLKLFFPQEKWVIFWVLMGPFLLLCSSILWILSSAPLQAVVLMLGIFLMMASYFAPQKIAQISLGLILLFTLYCIKGQEFRGVLWSLQLALSLFVIQETIFSAKSYLFSSVKLKKEFEEDAQLWRSRFETLREKIESDREVWEGEIDTANNHAQKQVAYANSLRRLVETAHGQIRMLELRNQQLTQEQTFAMSGDPEALERLERENFIKTLEIAALKKKEDPIHEELALEREKTATLEALLAEARNQLAGFENAFEARRSRNQELLTTSQSKPITLQSLGKKIRSK